MDSKLPESTIRLLAATDWWIRLLASTAERMGESVDDFGIQPFFESYPIERLEQYFTRAEIEHEIGLRGPDVVSIRLQADSLFIAGALYQVNGFLHRLAKLGLWRGELASTGNRFRQIYKENRIKKLRNVIEHADEHIALDKGEIAADFDSGLGTKIWGRAGGRGIGPESIVLFGNRYDVLEAIEAARAVHQHIQYEVPDSMMREPPWK